MVVCTACVCVREGRERKRDRDREGKDSAMPALVHDTWADIEDVISITFTGLIKLPRSPVLFIHLQLIHVTLSFELHFQQLLRRSFEKGSAVITRSLISLSHLPFLWCFGQNGPISYLHSLMIFISLHLTPTRY